MSLLKALLGKEKFTGRHLLIVGVIVVFFLIFTCWSVSYSSTPEFCTTCHEMGSYHQSWTSSAHKNVSCIDCHSEPGIAGLVKTKANGAKQLYTHLASSDINPKAPTNEVNCLSCHQDKVSTNVEQAMLRKSPHTIKHFENGMNCLTCHSGLVHNTQTNNTLPTRDTCVTCHLDQMKK